MLKLDDTLDHEHPPADQSLPIGLYLNDGREYPDVGIVLPGPHRNDLARLFSASLDLLREIKRLRDQYTKIVNLHDITAHDWNGMYHVDEAIRKAEGN